MSYDKAVEILIDTLESEDMSMEIKEKISKNFLKRLTKEKNG